MSGGNKSIAYRFGERSSLGKFIEVLSGEQDACRSVQMNDSLVFFIFFVDAVIARLDSDRSTADIAIAGKLDSFFGYTDSYCTSSSKGDQVRVKKESSKIQYVPVSLIDCMLDTICLSSEDGI